MMKRKKLSLCFALASFCFCISCQYSPRQMLLSLEDNDEEIIDRNKNFVPVSRNGKWGFIDDETRTLAIDLKFEHVGHFSEFIAPASIIDHGEELWGYIDTLGQWVITPRFNEAKEFSEGLAGVNVGGIWFYIDHSGDHSAFKSMQWTDIYDFSEGLAGVFDSAKRFQYIDKTGAVVVPNNGMDDGAKFSNGLARVWSNWKVGFINRQGEYVIQPQYGNAHDFSDGVAAVKVGSFLERKWGYIDQNNKVVIGAIYDHAEDFKKGYACVAFDDRYFIIDKKGNVVSDTYDMIREYNDGLAPASKNGKWGFVNRAGKLVIPLQYDEVVPFGFNNGHCWVILGNNMIKIDRQGNVLSQGPRN